MLCQQETDFAHRTQFEMSSSTYDGPPSPSKTRKSSRMTSPEPPPSVKHVPAASQVPFRHTVVLLAVWFGGQNSPAYGQQVESIAPASTQEESEDNSAAKNGVRPSFDLGIFNLRELRFRSNVTAKIVFSLHLALPLAADEKTAARLESWRHRLRDQVIIAVRKSEIRDFLEPNLSTLRRNIMLRINRLLKKSLVEEVLLTEFTFTTH